MAAGPVRRLAHALPSIGAPSDGARTGAVWRSSSRHPDNRAQHSTLLNVVAILAGILPEIG